MSKIRTYVLGASVGLAVIGGAGLALLKGAEGVEYQAYRDAAGIWTIGYGHTGPEVYPGLRWTQEQVDAALEKDIIKHRSGVLSCLRAPLNQNQMDAVVILTFNIGVRAYCNSTLNRKLNAGDYTGAANEFRKWNKVTINGRKVPLRGLTARRNCERTLFLAPAGALKPTRVQIKETLTNCPFV